MTYGVVGLGIGIGALCKNDTWEYQSQLGTSTGNLLFMGIGMLAVTLQTAPVAVLYAVFTERPLLTVTPDLATTLLLTILAGTAMINRLMRSIAVGVGVRGYR